MSIDLPLNTLIIRGTRIEGGGYRSFNAGLGTLDVVLLTNKVELARGPSKIRVQSLFVCFIDDAMLIWL
jgi:hypothetical protein